MIDKVKKTYVRDVTFKCENLTLFESLFLRSVVEALERGKEVKIETDEEFEKRMNHERTNSTTCCTG